MTQFKPKIMCKSEISQEMCVDMQSEGGWGKQSSNKQNSFSYNPLHRT